jgi:hypothetical protein
MGADSIEGLKKKLPSIKAELTDPVKYKELYKYTFDFTRDEEYKNISIENAIVLWELFLTKKCKFLKLWIEFYKVEKKDHEVI